VETIVKHLKGGDVSLRTLCATALFKVRDNQPRTQASSRYPSYQRRLGTEFPDKLDR